MWDQRTFQILPDYTNTDTTAAQCFMFTNYTDFTFNSPPWFIADIRPLLVKFQISKSSE